MAAVNALYISALKGRSRDGRGLESPIGWPFMASLPLLRPFMAESAVPPAQPFSYAERSASAGWMSSRMLGDIVEQSTMLLMYCPFAPAGFAR